MATLMIVHPLGFGDMIEGICSNTFIPPEVNSYHTGGVKWLRLLFVYSPLKGIAIVFSTVADVHEC